MLKQLFLTAGVSEKWSIFKKMDLEEIVREMKSLNFKSQTAWFRFYKLLKLIEDQELYREGYPIESYDGKTLRYITDSLSAWIGAFCEDTDKTSRSRAQEIIRAGRILDEFLEKNDMDSSDLGILPAPETLNNIQKLVSKEVVLGSLEDRADRIDYYIKEAAAGNLSRNKSRKLLKESTKKSPFIDKNRNPSKKSMAELIAHDGSWIGGQKWHEGIYKGFSNFSLPSGKKGVVVFEDLDKDGIACNLFLIAPEKQDLMTVQDDLKMFPLNEYFDYTWLMVADENDLDNFELPSEVGILEYKPFDIKIKKPAEKNAKSDTSWVFREYVKRVH